MVRLARYVQRYDRPEFHERVQPAAVLTACAVMAGLVALGAWVPFTRDAIQLVPAWALGCIAAYAAVSGVAHFLCQRKTGSVPGLTLHFFSAAVLHAFVASLIVDSTSWPFRFAAGAMLLFTLASHGEVLRATLDAPWLALTSFLLVVPAATYRSKGECLAYLLLMHALGLYVLFVMGHQATATDRLSAQLQDEQQALAASLLAQAHSSAARLEQQLVGLMGVHHDAGNLLTTALLATGSLQRKLESDRPPEGLELTTALQKVTSALNLVNSVFTSSLRAQ